MKALILFISILVFTTVVSAQEKCDLDVGDAPRLLNLRLGMTADEINAVLKGDLKVKVKPNGQRSFLRNYRKKEPKGSLQGVRALFLRFFDGRLYQIEIFYKDDAKPSNLGTFTNDYSSENGFPKAFWKIKHGYATAKCVGFSLRADTILNPHIELTDETGLEKIKAAEKLKKSQKKKESDN